MLLMSAEIRIWYLQAAVAVSCVVVMPYIFSARLTPSPLCNLFSNWQDTVVYLDRPSHFFRQHMADLPLRRTGGRVAYRGTRCHSGCSRCKFCSRVHSATVSLCWDFVPMHSRGVVQGWYRSNLTSSSHLHLLDHMNKPLSQN